MTQLESAAQSVVPGPEASADTFLEMWILGSHPRPT